MLLLMSLIFLSVVVSASIGISTGEPQIISVGQEMDLEEVCCPKVILPIVIKNTGEFEGGFVLFIEAGNGFTLKNNWHGIIDPHESKNLELELSVDPSFYGEANYKIILEETLSKEQSIYEDSFVIPKKNMTGVEGKDIPGIKYNLETKSFPNYVVLYIFPLIVIIGILIYFKVLKFKHNS